MVKQYDYPASEIKFDRDDFPSDFEERDTTIKRIVDWNNFPNDPTIHEIAVIGSSQTWGAGISSEGRSFSDYLEKFINQEFSKQPTTVFNAGIPGELSSSLNLLECWSKIRADLIIVNLTFNDAISPTNFRGNLDEFVKQKKMEEVEVVFILEPVFVETDSIKANHDIMQKIARQHNIQVVNMHGYLKPKYDEGQLWWDQVHLTDYGHYLFAEKLFEELKVYYKTAPK